MAKQEELRKLLSRFAQQVRTHHEAAKLASEPANERRAERSMREAENRIFSFFDQMRKTIDGLSADVERRVHVNKLLATERDEAVRQVTGLVQHMAAVEHQLTLLEATNEKLRKDAAPGAEDTFVPFDLARKDGLEALIGMPGTGEWHPVETYFGLTSAGFHVIEVKGRGIVVVTDAAVGLRHRVKAKTVTLHVNVYKRDDQYSAGCISVDRNESLNQMTNADYLGTYPVTVTVAE